MEKQTVINKVSNQRHHPRCKRKSLYPACYSYHCSNMNIQIKGKPGIKSTSIN